MSKSLAAKKTKNTDIEMLAVLDKCTRNEILSHKLIFNHL
jgi:hypothetical protein